MLVQAITRKEELINEFKKLYYSDDMMYLSGCISSWCPDISECPDENTFQYAVVNKNNKLIGYISYRINWYNSCASQFGIVSFDKGNPLFGKDLFDILEDLIHKYKLHRIEWRMVGDNPAQRGYDSFTKRYNGTKHILKDTFKDKLGNYHDVIIYEIINE